jgi:WD40 repeat protein
MKDEINSISSLLALDGFLYASSQRSVFKYDIEAGKRLLNQQGMSHLIQFPVHLSAVNDLIVFLDSIFTCSGDSLIKQWNVVTFELVKTFAGRITTQFEGRPSGFG